VSGACGKRAPASQHITKRTAASERGSLPDGLRQVESARLLSPARAQSIFGCSPRHDGEREDEEAEEEEERDREEEECKAAETRNPLL